jgi:hypothetical protein
VATVSNHPWRRLARRVTAWLSVAGISQATALGLTATWRLTDAELSTADNPTGPEGTRPVSSTRLADPPSGHPERWPAGPPTETERRLWSQLEGLTDRYRQT